MSSEITNDTVSNFSMIVSYFSNQFCLGFVHYGAIQSEMMAVCYYGFGYSQAVALNVLLKPSW